MRSLGHPLVDIIWGMCVHQPLLRASPGLPTRHSKPGKAALQQPQGSAARNMSSRAQFVLNLGPGAADKFALCHRNRILAVWFPVPPLKTEPSPRETHPKSAKQVICQPDLCEIRDVDQRFWNIVGGHVGGDASTRHCEGFPHENS